MDLAIRPLHSPLKRRETCNGVKERVILQRKLKQNDIKEMICVVVKVVLVGIDVCLVVVEVIL